MPSKIPSRDMIVPNEYMVVPQFSEYIGKRFKALEKKKNEAYTASGLISGGKLGKPALWAVLSMLGFVKDFDEYTLGKFQRGNDVEARAINMLTDIPMDYINQILSGQVADPGWIDIPKGAMLEGKVYLQLKGGYRGGTGYIDLAQETPSGRIIYHEVKSSTKMAYDKVAASGASKSSKTYGYRNGKRTVLSETPNSPAPYVHHALQLAYYALGDDVASTYLHYFNADDYRLISFAINPLHYKEEIDFEIDQIQSAFLTKTMPPFEVTQEFHKIKNYQDFGDEWNLLSPAEVLKKLESEFPEGYEKFMTTYLPNA